MSESNLLIIWLTRCVAQSPTVLVTLVACVIVLVKWQQASSGAGWALLGFALALALGLLAPFAQILLQRWMIESYAPMASVGRASTLLALSMSVLHALGYASLLVAVFAGRRSSPPPLPPPGSADAFTR